MMQDETKCKYKITSAGSKMKSKINVISFVVDVTMIIYYTILMISTLDDDYQNRRIVWYCVIFIWYDGLCILQNHTQLVDPLQLKPTTVFLGYFKILCHFNILYLLIRNLFALTNFHCILIITQYVICMGHFESLITYLNQHNNDHNFNKQINTNHYNSIKIITPITLYIMSMSFDENESKEISLIQLILLIINVIGLMQNKKILMMKQSYFGWITTEHKGKVKSIWKRYKALKIIIIAACIMITIENLLLLFEGIRSQISLATVFTLIVALTSYYVYKDTAKSYQ